MPLPIKLLLMLFVVLSGAACSYNPEELNELINDSRSSYTVIKQVEGELKLRLYSPPSSFIAFQNLSRSGELTVDNYNALVKEWQDRRIVYADFYFEHEDIPKTDVSIQQTIRDRSLKIQSELTGAINLNIGGKYIRPNVIHFEPSHGLLPYERLILHFTSDQQENSELAPNLLGLVCIQSNSLFSQEMCVQLPEIDSKHPTLKI